MHIQSAEHYTGVYSFSQKKDIGLLRLVQEYKSCNNNRILV